MKYNIEDTKVIVEFGTTIHCKKQKQLLSAILDNMIILEKMYCTKKSVEVLEEIKEVALEMPEVKQDPKEHIIETPDQALPGLDEMPDLDLGDLQAKL